MGAGWRPRRWGQSVGSSGVYGGNQRLRRRDVSGNSPEESVLGGSGGRSQAAGGSSKSQAGGAICAQPQTGLPGLNTPPCSAPSDQPETRVIPGRRDTRGGRGRRAQVAKVRPDSCREGGAACCRSRAVGMWTGNGGAGKQRQRCSPNPPSPALCRKPLPAVGGSKTLRPHTPNLQPTCWAKGSGDGGRKG